ncbi:MAG: cyclase family protein [Saprospiraceae bacterium]|nr:cyclase family protein [Saprospiraceae bacterium]
MPASFHLTGSETIIELGHPLSGQIPTYPGDPPLRFSRLSNVRQDGYALHQISGTAHSGTHLDAPAHFLEAGMAIDGYPASHWMGRAMLMDVKGQATIDQADLDQVRSANLDFLLFRTGWDQFYNTSQYFDQHPVFCESFALQLAALSLKGIGMDLPGPDLEPYPIHPILFNAGMVIIENMTNLDQLTEGQPFMFLALPLSWSLEASWVRPLAFLSEPS